MKKLLILILLFSCTAHKSSTDIKWTGNSGRKGGWQTDKISIDDSGYLTTKNNSATLESLSGIPGTMGYYKINGCSFKVGKYTVVLDSIQCRDYLTWKELRIYSLGSISKDSVFNYLFDSTK